MKTFWLPFNFLYHSAVKLSRIWCQMRCPFGQHQPLFFTQTNRKGSVHSKQIGSCNQSWGLPLSSLSSRQPFSVVQTKTIQFFLWSFKSTQTQKDYNVHPFTEPQLMASLSLKNSLFQPTKLSGLLFFSASALLALCLLGFWVCFLNNSLALTCACYLVCMSVFAHFFVAQYKKLSVLALAVFFFL